MLVRTERETVDNSQDWQGFSEDKEEGGYRARE